MCIKRVEAWAFDGKTYEHEIDAVQVAVENMIGNPGTAKAVLGRIGELLPLLNRYDELRVERAAGRAAPGNAEKDPSPEGPDAPPMPPAAVCDLLASTFRNKAKDNKPAMQKVIRGAGYEDLAELLDQATDMHVNALLAKLMDNSVGKEVLDAQGHSVTCRARATGFEADCNCGVLIRNRAIYR